MEDKIDILDRQPFVDRLIEIVRLIADSGRGCTFTIDGRWGCGKSFVLDMFEKQLSIFQDPNAAGDRYVIFHYNCWQYDFYEEPAIAIISAIKSEIEKYNSILPKLPNEIKAGFELVKDLGKELLGNYIQTKIGYNPIHTLEKIKAGAENISHQTMQDNDYDKYFKFKEVLDSTREDLSKLAQDKPVILVVDELDRCLPEYTIKVLERLHHLFDENSNIIVILATDQKQLERTVQQIFCTRSGEDNSHVVQEYLKKFISFSMTLNNGTITESFWERYATLLKNYNIGDEIENGFFKEIPLKLLQNIDPRTQERLMDRMRTLHQLSFSEHNGPEVLYFELFHQVLRYRFNSHGYSWLMRINESQDTTVVKAIGKDLYTYLKDLESFISGNTILSNGNGENYHILDDSPLAVSFWLIASLVSKPHQGICVNYSLKTFSKYGKLVECANRFDKLSSIIK